MKNNNQGLLDDINPHIRVLLDLQQQEPVIKGKQIIADIAFFVCLLGCGAFLVYGLFYTDMNRQKVLGYSSILLFGVLTGFFMWYNWFKKNRIGESRLEQYMRENNIDAEVIAKQIETFVSVSTTLHKHETAMLLRIAKDIRALAD